MCAFEARLGYHRLILASLAALCSACAADVTGTCGVDARVETIGFLNPGPLNFIRLQSGARVDPLFYDRCGARVNVSSDDVVWSSSDASVVTVEAFEGGEAPAAWVAPAAFGNATVTVSVGSIRGDIEVTVEKPPHTGTGFSVLGFGAVLDGYTDDVWVQGDHAFTITQSGCLFECEREKPWIFAWHLLPDGGIEKADSVALSTQYLTNIRVSVDGSFAVVGQAYGTAEENGIVVLELAQPTGMTVAARYNEHLEAGVGNVWIERVDGRDFVFVAAAGGLRVIDVTNRASPTEAAFYATASAVVRDVRVRDGLAFVSAGEYGLVILDVGNGIKGGSPTHPEVVSRVTALGNAASNAWYWAVEKKVFLGVELLARMTNDPVGKVRVLDVSDLEHPVEVATINGFELTPRNLWMDEARDVLFVPMGRLRAYAMGGTLSGTLETQGREIAWVRPSGPNGAGGISALQLHAGLIYVADAGNGIWSVRLDR